MECRLLALPGELRNTIYELAFSFSEAAEVDLLRAQPPSKALLMTCRRIYDEARLIHRDAHRAYWSTQTFTLRPDVNTKAMPEVANLMSTIRRLKKDDVLHIKKLSVLPKVPSNNRCWSYEAGSWTLQYKIVPGKSETLAQRLLVPPEKTSQMAKAGTHLILSANTGWKATLKLHWSVSELQEAKRMLQSPGLNREEIVWAAETVLNIGYSGGCF